MIIVDTSVWIDFLKGKCEHSFLFNDLIENREVLLIECITGELLQGAKNQRERDIILKYWESLPHLSSESLWIEAGLYSAKNKLTSKGIGLIDGVLIAAGVKTLSKIWTLDKKLLGVLPVELIFQV